MIRPVLKHLANFLRLPPSGGSEMLSADMGTYLWLDRYGRHWAWQRGENIPPDQEPDWIPISQFRGYGPDAIDLSKDKMTLR